MIRTAKNARRALLLGHDGRGMVAADVVERTQLVIIAAHDDQRFAGEIGSDILARLLELIRSRHDLPRAPKYASDVRVRRRVRRHTMKPEWCARDRAGSARRKTRGCRAANGPSTKLRINFDCVTSAVKQDAEEAMFG